MGNASKQRCHPRHVAVIYPRLVRATEKNFIHRFPIAFSELFPQSPQWNCGQIVRADLRERSAVPPNRRSYSLTNKCRRHSRWFPLPIRRVLRVCVTTTFVNRNAVGQALLPVLSLRCVAEGCCRFVPRTWRTHSNDAL